MTIHNIQILFLVYKLILWFSSCFVHPVCSSSTNLFDLPHQFKNKIYAEIVTNDLWTSFPFPLSINPSQLHSFITKHPGKSLASSLAFRYQLVFWNCSHHNCNTITHSKFPSNLFLPVGSGDFFPVVSVAPDIIHTDFHENHCFGLVWFASYQNPIFLSTFALFGGSIPCVYVLIKALLYISFLSHPGSFFAHSCEALIKYSGDGCHLCVTKV